MDPSLIAVILSLTVTTLGAVISFFSKKGEKRDVNDANLRDDQRELLTKLYERDDVSQTRIEKLIKENEEIRAQMEKVRQEFQAQVNEMRDERRDARFAREIAESRGAAEVGARSRLSKSIPMNEATIKRAGDAAEKVTRAKQDAEEEEDD